MLESGEIHPLSVQKNLHRKLQLFCTTGAVALWSKIKIKKPKRYSSAPISNVE
jgi:hypothetical protein